MVNGGGDARQVDLSIPELERVAHRAHATCDSETEYYFSHPSQPWLAAMFTKRVPWGMLLSKLIILFDSACTSHIATESWLLDDFQFIRPEKIQRGKGEHVMFATGKITLVTQNSLPNGEVRVTSFEGVLFVPRIGTTCFRSRKSNG